MNNEEKRALFESLARIMSQNQKIERHFDIQSHDRAWSWGGGYTDRLIGDCNSIARRCEDDGK